MINKAVVILIITALIAVLPVLADSVINDTFETGAYPGWWQTESPYYIVLDNTSKLNGSNSIDVSGTAVGAIEITIRNISGINSTRYHNISWVMEWQEDRQYQAFGIASSDGYNTAANRVMYCINNPWHSITCNGDVIETVSAGDISNYRFEFDNTTESILVYINGVYTGDNLSYLNSKPSAEFFYGVSNTYTGTEAYIDNFVVQDEQVPPPQHPNMYVRAYDLYDNSTVNDFTVRLDNMTNYTTSNGTVILANFTIGAYTYNVTYPDYFNVTNNITTNLTQNDTDYYELVYPHQVEVRFRGFDLFSDQEQNFNFTVNGTTQESNETFNLTAAYFTYTAHSTGYFNKSGNYTFTALDNITINVSDMYTTKLLISPRDIINNNTIDEANITLQNSTYSWSSSVSNVTNATFNVTPGTYRLYINATDRVNLIENITITDTGNTTYYAYMYAYNSLWVYAYNQADLSSITTFNVTVYDGANNTYYNETNVGVAQFDNITSGNYTVEVSAPGYTTASYSVVMTDNSFQSLDAYLTSSGDTFIFTVKDEDTNGLVESAGIAQYRLINASYTLVSSQNTDITGRAQFSYLEGIEYRFIITKSGYITKTFLLTILFDDYIVLLEPNITTNPDVFTDDVIITWGENYLYNNNLSWQSITIDSPQGSLEDYHINITTSGNSSNTAGNNSNGETINGSVYITGAGFGSTAVVTVSYKSTYNVDWVTITRIYQIQNWQTQAGSLEDIKNDIDELSDLERWIIGTLIAIAFVGIAGMGGSVLGEGLLFGSSVGLIVYGVLTYLGFFTWPTFYVVAFILGLVIMSRLGER